MGGRFFRLAINGLQLQAKTIITPAMRMSKDGRPTFPPLPAAFPWGFIPCIQNSYGPKSRYRIDAIGVLPGRNGLAKWVAVRSSGGEGALKAYPEIHPCDDSNPQRKWLKRLRSEYGWSELLEVAGGKSKRTWEGWELVKLAKPIPYQVAGLLAFFAWEQAWNA